MLRVVLNHVKNRVLPYANSRVLLKKKICAPLWIPRANITKLPQDHDETDEEYEDRMECYFNRPDIDGWEVRKGLNELAGMDIIPDSRVIIAALCACRRVNDYSLTTRTLEMIKFKCDANGPQYYPYVMKMIVPALEELGIATLEKMGYDRPELGLKSVYDM